MQSTSVRAAGVRRKALRPWESRDTGDDEVVAGRVGGRMTWRMTQGREDPGIYRIPWGAGGRICTNLRGADR
jgi:hypothetical protein